MQNQKKLGHVLAQAELKHLLIAGACALIILGAVLAQSGVSLRPLQGRASDPSMSYDAIRAQVEAERAQLAAEDPALQTLRDQLALIDPSLNEGEVLGAISEEMQNYPDAQTLFTPEVLAQIPIKEIVSTSKETVQRYFDALVYVESYHDVITMFGNLNSADTEATKSVAPKAKDIIQSLAIMSVPEELVEYHRLKMAHYTILGNLGDVFSGVLNDDDFVNNSQVLFSILDRMEAIKTTISEKYKVNI